jgi:hypothetical protein
MKILVFSTPRSGGTNFTHALSQVFKLQRYLSPFKLKSTSVDDEKFLLELISKDQILIKQDPISKNLDQFKKLIDHFDHNQIILLSRSNLKEATESYAYMEYHFLNGNFKPSASKYLWSKTPNYDDMEKTILKSYENLYIISEYLNKKMVSYEDLYYNKQKQTLIDLGFKDYIKDIVPYLDLGKKQRQSDVGVNKLI